MFSPLPLFLAKKKVQGAPKRKRSCRFPLAPCWAKPNVASQGFCPARFPQKKAVALEAGVNWNLLAKRFIKNEPA